ncbi:hypothetical protein J4418_03200 [Candidatus Woesearchaeota archaeon]|nr:hypothetical protein [Candidatus Woesearchaeota archaeon]
MKSVNLEPVEIDGDYVGRHKEILLRVLPGEINLLIPGDSKYLSNIY